jgi:hypothetical protein
MRTLHKMHKMRTLMLSMNFYFIHQRQLLAIESQGGENHELDLFYELAVMNMANVCARPIRTMWMRRRRRGQKQVSAPAATNERRGRQIDEVCGVKRRRQRRACVCVCSPSSSSSLSFSSSSLHRLFELKCE